MAPGFSEMLKHTILSKAQENQKRNSLNAPPQRASQPQQAEYLGNTQLDPQLEADLLSLDQSQITQNMIKEFIQTGQLDGQTGINRKASMPISAINNNDSTTLAGRSANSHLESLIHQLIVRKEITQSPNIQQRRTYNAG